MNIYNASYLSQGAKNGGTCYISGKYPNVKRDDENKPAWEWTQCGQRVSDVIVRRSFVVSFQVLCHIH